MARATQLTIRRAAAPDAEIIAAIHVASWEASYRGLLDDAEFEKRPLAIRVTQWSNILANPQTLVLVAGSTDGTVCGFASARFLDRETTGFDSYLATLYLLPEWKGRGIGRALLRAIACELLGGATNMMLRTLRNNPARSFYERLGARFVPEHIDVDAGHFDDVVYAFDDLAALAISRS